MIFYLCYNSPSLAQRGLQPRQIPLSRYCVRKSHHMCLYAMDFARPIHSFYMVGARSKCLLSHTDFARCCTLSPLNVTKPPKYIEYSNLESQELLDEYRRLLSYVE